MWCVTRHDGRRVAEREEQKLSYLANKMTHVVRRDYSHVAIVESVIKFSASFVKEHSVSFLAAQMVNIVEDMAPSDFLSDNSSQT